jgi:hypothetical protein
LGQLDLIGGDDRGLRDFDWLPAGVVPNCMVDRPFTVEGCEVCGSGALGCPCLIEPDYASYLGHRWAHRVQFRDERREWERRLVDAIDEALRDHGIPLHYSVIAGMIVDRHPELTKSENTVYNVIVTNKDKFRAVSPGVYTTA